MKVIQYLSLLLPLALLTACGTTNTESVDPTTTAAASVATDPAYPYVESTDDRLSSLIAPGTTPERLGGGFEWAEGPEWIPGTDGGMLVFSDVRANRAYKWTAAGGVEVYLEPSGFTGAYFAGKEPGSNRLFTGPDGSLYLCQHGDRRIARMTSPVTDPKPEFTTLVGFYEGKRLNSPNDVVWHENGDLYFTDPPYGLPGGQEDSSVKELDFQGVYRFRFQDSSLTLLTSEIPRPNGIAFTPDYRYLLVANSQASQATWTKYPVLDDGTLGEGELFRDLTDRTPSPFENIPDGMAMHSSGNLFATGPGGVLIFSPEGEELGVIRTGQTTANCTFNEDESMLYITADSVLLRVAMVVPEG